MEKDYEELVVDVLDELIAEGQFKIALKAMKIIESTFSRYNEYLEKINLEMSKVMAEVILLQ